MSITKAIHCSFATVYEQTNYSKQQAEIHQRKIILPSVIPWECGTNRFASQKGTTSFGTTRNTTTKIESSKELSESSDAVIPWITCPDRRKKCATQSGQTPFGGIIEHVKRVQEHDGEAKKDIHDLINDPMSDRLLKKWSQPNPNAKNDRIGSRRSETTTTTVGGRRFTKEELIKSRAAIPRFHDPRENAAHNSAGTGVGMCGHRAHRQVTTQIEGLDRSEQDNLDSNRYMSWLGGQLTLQSQSHTGGFNKHRDIANSTYYDDNTAKRGSPSAAAGQY